MYDCIESQSLLVLKPKYLISTSVATQKEFDKNFTKYGDSLCIKYKNEQELLDLAMQVPDNDLQLLIRQMKKP